MLCCCFILIWVILSCKWVNLWFQKLLMSSMKFIFIIEHLIQKNSEISLVCSFWHNKIKFSEPWLYDCIKLFQFNKASACWLVKTANFCSNAVILFSDSSRENEWIQTMNDSRKEVSFKGSYRVKGVRYRSACATSWVSANIMK